MITPGSFLETPGKAFRYAVRPWRLHFSAMLALIVTANVCVYSIPYVLKLIADIMTAGNPLVFEDFHKPLLFLALLYLGQEIFFRTGHVLETYLTPRAFERVTTTLYENLLARPAAYFEEQFSGELNRRLEQVSSGIQYFLEWFPWEMGWTLIASVMAIVLLTTVHPLLVFVFLVWLILFTVLSFFLLRWQYRRSQDLAEKHASLSGILVDSLGNIPLVHAFAAQRYETSYYERFMDKTVRSEKSERRVGILNRIHQGLSIALLGLAFIPTSIYLFLQNAMTVGDFVIITALLPTLTGVIWTFGETVLRGIRTYGSLKNAVQSLRSDVKPVENGSRELALDESPAITFDAIVFAYPGSPEKVFGGLSLRIKTGEKVGLVGRSGVGKSTLVKLLLRNYDPDGGTVKIDGQDIADFTLESLRRNISFVPQDTSLFHRTLYENILYARPASSKEEVMEASKQAHAHEFIMEYPEGYETKVGERGVKLSGGQKQRIALARALLKNAPILVLDEATSSLDSESEEIVQKALLELFQGRTVLAIAHRLSTLRSMDRIIVLEKGEVVEDGSPQELLSKKDGAFKAMWEHQKGGFV